MKALQFFDEICPITEEIKKAVRTYIAIFDRFC